MKLFDLDSPLMQFLGKVADLMLLNLITLICCIPVFTVGASLTALNYMSLKIVRGEECYIWKGYFKSFRQNFKQATLIWLIYLFAIIILAGDFYVMQNSGLEFHVALKIVIAVIAFLLLFTGMFVFPVLAKFDNTIKMTMKNAFIMSVLQFPKTILMIILYLVLPVVAILFPQTVPIAFLFGLSAPAFVSAMLYNKFFQKLEDQVLAEQEPEVTESDSEEDERIFKDELDEALITDQIAK